MAHSTSMQPFFTGSHVIGRRNKVYLFSPSEKIIYDAIQVIENLGADSRLTDAVNLLQQAKDAVSDFIDEEIGGKE